MAPRNYEIPSFANEPDDQLHLFQSIVNFLPDPTLIIDSQGRVALWNRAIEELTGVKAEHILGKGNFEHSHCLYGERKPSLIDRTIGHDLQADLIAEKDASSRQIGEAKTIYGETRCLKACGQEGYFRIKAAPLYNAKGMLVGAIASLQDITEAKKNEDKINELNCRDYLTGLFNRAYIREELKYLDTEDKLPLSIIRAEICGLKLINETFGYHQGDNLIVHGAAAIRKACYSKATICRWNGSGFTIFLPQTDFDTSINICRAIEDACRECKETPVNLTVSLGAATKTKSNQDTQEVINEAEKMMLRNNVIVSKDMRGSIISSLQKLLEEKTEETVEHAFRINAYASEIGRVLGLSPAEIHELTLLAALHDVGKIAIPDSIILKTEKLAPEEWEIMKKHAQIGYNMTQSITELAHISKKILHHHEWWNGQGYPDGLAGEEIPLLSRIIAVVDAYDVMTSGRSYKKSFSKKKALRELQKYSGTHFEPRLVDIFINIQQNKSSAPVL